VDSCFKIVPWSKSQARSKIIFVHSLAESETLTGDLRSLASSGAVPFANEGLCVCAFDAKLFDRRAVERLLSVSTGAVVIATVTFGH